MADTAADRLLPAPTAGRIWRGTRPVRFGDVDVGGRLRLDAIATYMQDLASDDTADAGLGGDMVWVVRRAVIEVRVGPRFLDKLDLATWCGGLGPRWAERCVSMETARGASVDAAMLWVSLDHASGRPVPLPAGFVDRYGESAGGREVSARLRHPGRVPSDAAVRPWALRATDLDLLGHVNNAAAWAMVEEVLADSAWRGPVRAEIEYRVPIERGCSVELAVWSDAEGSTWLWAFGLPADAPAKSAPVLFTTARFCAI